MMLSNNINIIMILTFLFSLGLLGFLVLYFVLVGALDFKSNPMSMEKKMSGTPSRRTVHRKNTDIVTFASKILGGYIVLNLTFYVLPDFRAYLFTNTVMVILVCLIAGGVFYVLPLINRATYAYLGTGHIMLIHVVCALSTFLSINAFFYDVYPPAQDILLLAGFVLSVSAVFLRY